MSDLINISISNALVTAILGYAVVFFGLVLLMIVIMVMGKVMVNAAQKAEAKAAAEAEEKKASMAAAVEEAESKEPAPGSAGELKLYDTDPRDAAMIMAIIADALGRPINELRFISIKEVEE